MSLRELFLFPQAWPLLALAPMVWFLHRQIEARRTQRLATVVGQRGGKIARESSAPARALARRLATVGTAAAALAAMQPLVGESESGLVPRGADVVLVLDVSRSMLARDLAPDRLDRARREIRELLAQAPDDRFGLVVFAGEARLLVPLSRDHDSLSALLDEVDPSMVARGGTDIGKALEVAAEALDAESGDHAALILLTDGEDHEGRGRVVAERIGKARRGVHCVGFGTAEGAKIPVPSRTGDETWLVDREGRDVVTRLEPTSLEAIAAATGGEYLDAGSRPRALPEIHQRRILPAARRSFEAERRRQRTNRFQWPLVAAVAAWSLAVFLHGRSRR